MASTTPPIIPLREENLKPAPRPVAPEIVGDQAGFALPLSTDLVYETGLCIPPVRTIDRLSNFPEEVYSLEPESHVVRFMKVLLGDAGVGQLRKTYLIQRLRETLEGAHFFDLDKFYGVLFGITRWDAERLIIDPAGGVATAEMWDRECAKDASYRSRIKQFARALGFGATPLGMELIAEAVLAADCAVYETFTVADQTFGTYGDIEGSFGDYGVMEDLTYGELEGTILATQLPNRDRYQFIIVPRREISEEERYGVLRVVERLKPANTLALISNAGLPVLDPVTLRGVISESEYWEIRNKVIPNNSAYTVPSLDGGPVEQPKPPFVAYQGEAWSYMNDVSGVLSYAAVHQLILPVAWNGDSNNWQLVSDIIRWDVAAGAPDHIPSDIQLQLGWAPTGWTGDWSRVADIIDYDLAANAPDHIARDIQDQLATRSDSVTPTSFKDFQRLRFEDRASPLRPGQVTAAVVLPTFVDLSEIKGLMAPIDIVLGRAASDAVFLSSPTFSPKNFANHGPDTVDTMPAARYIDNIPVAEALAAIDTQSLATRMKATSDKQYHFWAVDVREQNDPTVEVLEARFNNARRVNYITFEVSRYPHVAQLELYSDELGRWIKVFSGTINESFPQKFPSLVALFGQDHPQHPLSGDHWVKFSQRISPLRASRVRVLLMRGPGSGPRDARGRPVGYSLAVRNLDVGYRITSANDLPREIPPLNGDQSLDSTTDIFGSSASFSVRRMHAIGLLQDPPLMWKSEPQPFNDAVVTLCLDTRDSVGNGQVIDRFLLDPLATGPTIHLYWSDLVPSTDFDAEDIPISSQNLTVAGSVLGLTTPPTTQTGSGSSSIVSSPTPAVDWQRAANIIRWDLAAGAPSHIQGDLHTQLGFLDTGWSGDWQKVLDIITWDLAAGAPSHILHDLDLQLGLASPPRPPTAPPVVVSPPPPSVYVPPTPPEGITFPKTDVGYIDIDNKAIQFDPRQPWWAAFEVRTAFDSATGTHPVFDFGGACTLQFEPDQVRFLSTFGDSAVLPTTFQVGGLARIVVAYVPVATDELVAGYTIWFQSDLGPTARVTAPLTYPLPQPITKLRFGGLQTPTPGAAAITLRAFTLKRATVKLADATAFIDDPGPYVRQAPYAPDDIGTTTNAILRFSPNYETENFRYGFVGGPGKFFGDVVWHPVERDYVLDKGYLHLPPIKAAFWKFEFTNLAAKPIESLVPVTRTVQKLPITQKTGPGEAPLDQGVDTFFKVAPMIGTVFKDLVNTTSFFLQNPNSTQYTPAEAITSVDWQRLIDMSSKAWAHGYQSIFPKHRASMFDGVNTHPYQTMEIESNKKVGYFVGLKSLFAYRERYDMTDDTQVYLERFWDILHIEPNYTFNVNPGWLDAGSGGSAQIVSKPYRSQSPVTAVQFATQESPGVQLIPNDDFTDPQMATSQWTNVADWHKIGDAALTYYALNNTVEINRNVEEQTRFLTRSGGLIQRPMGPVWSWRGLNVDDPVATNRLNGGIASKQIGVSPHGQIWAAVRFTAKTTPTAPWHLQIIGTDGTVLGQKDILPQEGQVVEEFVGYTLGSYVNQLGVTGDWMPRSLIQRPLMPVAHGDPAVPIGGFPSLDRIDGQVQVILYQNGLSHDRIQLDTLSLFEDGVLWEFSNNGGSDWFQPIAIKNNPNGVLAFPTPGTFFQWRATSYRPNTKISSVQIRPWYGRSLISRKRTQHWGPNVSAFDQYPPVEDDPEFKKWHKPVPYFWFQASRLFPVLPVEGGPQPSLYARFFGRLASDTISTATDGLVIFKQPGRLAVDILHTSDVARDGGGSVFARTVSEVLSTADNAHYNPWKARTATDSVAGASDTVTTVYTPTASIIPFFHRTGHWGR